MELTSDAMGKYNAKLVNILKRIKKELGMNDIIYMWMYLAGACSHRFYGLPKIHKNDTPLDQLFPAGSLLYNG